MIENCLKYIPNRFELVLVATYRSRQLVQGHLAKITPKNKSAVNALNEISEGFIGLEMLGMGKSTKSFYAQRKS